jgi:hypothetical protein
MEEKVEIEENPRNACYSSSDVESETKTVGEEANHRFVLSHAQQDRWLSTFAQLLPSH